MSFCQFFFKPSVDNGLSFGLFLQDTLQIKHDLDTRTKLCLSTDGSKVFMDICDGENEDQKWTFDAVDFSEFREDLGPPYDRSLDR